MEESNDTTTAKKISDTRFQISNLAYRQIYLNQRSEIIDQRCKGFTLVELIVSIAITGIMMVGISTFFSATFANLFIAQTRSANTQRQFAVNEIIRDKFLNLESLVEFDTAYILSLNKTEKAQLPFSYIGTTTIDHDGDLKKHLVFKDLMVFNKILLDGTNYIYGNSGAGELRKAPFTDIDPNLTPPTTFKNFAGFEKIVNTWYIVLPHENLIMECSALGSTCSSLDIDNLLSPTDVTSDPDGNVLFISDSENGLIIRYDTTNGDETVILTNLKYPTGLAYYDDGGDGVLFIAETFGNKVIKINATNPLFPSVVVGDGDNIDCDNTAKYCALNRPTGLFVDSAANELYIADSGNNRVLKVSDPGIPSSIIFNFEPSDDYALDKIEIVNDSWEGGVYNENESNLIGFATNWEPADAPLNTGTFANNAYLTSYSIINECESDDTGFYVSQDFTIYNSIASKKLIVDNNAYTVTGVSSEDCDPGEGSLTKWKLTTSEDATSIGDGETVFFSNPDKVVIQIDGVTSIDGGFQTFEINLYDVTSGLVETFYHVERVGDGILGTEEDIIEIIAANVGHSVTSGPFIKTSGTEEKIEGSLIFPTGVSDNFIISSGSNSIISPNGTVTTIDIIDTSTFDEFDYISEFSLDEATPIEFNKFSANGKANKILELLINAKIDQDTIQTYKINAVLP